MSANERTDINTKSVMVIIIRSACLRQRCTLQSSIIIIIIIIIINIFNVA